MLYTYSEDLAEIMQIISSQVERSGAVAKRRKLTQLVREWKTWGNGRTALRVDNEGKLTSELTSEENCEWRGGRGRRGSREAHAVRQLSPPWRACCHNGRRAKGPQATIVEGVLPSSKFKPAENGIIITALTGSLRLLWVKERRAVTQAHLFY